MAITVSNDVLSRTLHLIMEESVDSMYRDVPLLKFAQKNKMVKLFPGGSYITQAVTLKRHSSITQYTNSTGGYDAASLTSQDISRQAEYKWCDFSAPINISGSEELSNSGPEAIIDLASDRLTNVMEGLQLEWEQQAVIGFAVGGGPTGLTDLQSLNGVDAALGWLEEAAFGSQGNTVGGLVKSSFTDTWQNQVGDVTSTFATTGREKMYAVYNAARDRCPAGHKVDLILASPLSFNKYVTDAETQVVYAPSDALGNVSGDVMFMGAELHYEGRLPYIGSTNTLSMMFLNTKGIGVAFHKDANFRFDKFIDVPASDVKTSKIRVRTQIFAKHLASQGVLLNAEA